MAKSLLSRDWYHPTTATDHSVAVCSQVQRRVMPYLLSGRWEFQERDVVVTAPTGSGKTLVYVLTVLQVGGGGGGRE